MADLITLANAQLQVGISAKGAETQYLRDAKGRDWMWSGDPEIWSGRAPILFPIVAGSPQGRLRAGGIDSAMPKHGFARISDFALIAQGADHCRHELRDNAKTRAIYPFEFSLRISHALAGSRMTVSAEVENRGKTEMPFGFGFHPAFAWPLPGGQGTHQLVLQNGAEPALHRLNEQGLFDATALPSPFQNGHLTLDQSLFEQDAMIFPEGAGTALRFEAENGSALHFAWDGLPNLALWNKPGAPYICLEPWHGLPARADTGPEITQRPFTALLAPGASRRFSFSATVSA